MESENELFGCKAKERKERKTMDRTEENIILTVDAVSQARLGGLQEVSFSIARGGIHGLLGAKGAGKTALLDLLSGCAEAEKGHIEIAGVPMTRQNKELRSKIGYVEAKPSFYEDMTVLEILNFVGDARGVLPDRRYAQMEEAVDLFGLSAVQNRLCGALSTEDKKRLSFAAALLGNTELILLDEPLRGIGYEARDEIISLISLLGKHKTVLLASRDYELVRKLCADVVWLSDGMVVASDTFETLEENLRLTKQISLREAYDSMAGESSSDVYGEWMEEKTEEKTEQEENLKEENEEGEQV